MTSHAPTAASRPAGPGGDARAPRPRRADRARGAPARRAARRGGACQRAIAAAVMPMPTIASAFRVSASAWRLAARERRSAPSVCSRVSRSVSTPSATSSAGADRRRRPEQRVHQPDDERGRSAARARRTAPGCRCRRGRRAAARCRAARRCRRRPWHAAARCSTCRERERRQPPVERGAGPGERAGAHRVHAVAQRQRQQRQRGQHDQRLHAAAGEDAVEHLHHVDGRHQQRQVEQQARRAGQQHERPELLHEQPSHRRSPSMRRRAPIRGNRDCWMHRPNGQSAFGGAEVSPLRACRWLTDRAPIDDASRRARVGAPAVPSAGGAST